MCMSGQRGESKGSVEVAKYMRGGNRTFGRMKELRIVIHDYVVYKHRHAATYSGNIAWLPDEND